MKEKLLCLLCCFSLASFCEIKKLNIAVSDLIGQGVDQPSAAIISDRLRTSLFKEGGFTVLERNAMQDILKEQGFLQTGCTSDACAVEIGQLLGVSYIVVGTVGKLGHLFTIDIRMIEVATGKITYSENVDCDCPIEKLLTNSVVSIAKKISDNVKATMNAAVPSVKKPQQGEQQSRTNGSMAPDTANSGGGEGKSAPAARSLKPKKNPVFTISLGVAALAAAGAGYVFDNMLKGKIDDNAKLKAEYQLQPGNSQYGQYSGAIADNNKSATNYQTLRNCCYVLSGLCAAGFAITFLF